VEVAFLEAAALAVEEEHPEAGRNLAIEVSH
jgi:hypothetical protein